MIVRGLDAYDCLDPKTGKYSPEMFWEQKVSWAAADDRSSEGQHCIRYLGHHYVAVPGIVVCQPFMGFGGREMFWRNLTTGAHYFTNNLWHQGEIPEHFLDRLPDNAEFLDHNYPCICTRNDRTGHILDPDCLRS